MTGYGTAEGPLSGGRIVIQVRTVNHRHMSVQFRLPAELQPLENELRSRLRERMERGHVVVSARWVEEPPHSASIRLNVERAREVVEALTRLKSALNLGGEIDVGFVARQPDVLTYGEAEQAEINRAELMAVLDQALDEVVKMRTREGAALADDLEGRLGELDAALARIAARTPQRLTAERDRLQEAVQELLDGKLLDPDRLNQEIALLADKLDITEELVRIRTHLQACGEALATDAAVGRRLAFLGQEMLREVNTIGSKANDAEIAQTVIGMKGELERIREQVENIE
ncbi:MAG: YicC family protein [Gemmatimonadales bacterium]|nr:YicC family protein [Gemmatimonadales bacterium]NIN50136.1 YicC family protein [Gemmatimonadales bacterium]NIP07600.1 YicC family protein [Gemmatimonadales bacterium]NIS65655.1 YicC family protein [Gemmatimonadales bacterium]